LFAIPTPYWFLSIESLTEFLDARGQGKRLGGLRQRQRKGRILLAKSGQDASRANLDFLVIDRRMPSSQSEIDCHATTRFF
jgi:hypothetical protein